ncbi:MULTISPECIES: DUF3429 domain-containing protein [Methylobacterium]|uniref:DUF3429 domain-containing protein n=1 Tax=Methylobacterium jeotgali TaxID=381630 RepID=A0ABQ4SWA3_9HYPH|nr:MULTISPECIES: DUF3429 domain-containing protein [Methylobacterium]PIU07373.1 MAG: DUF3429 domain-containing protein [Methylobacterium sp. CG09_land_8_20_14_0_10_71_15]PIU11929.1 MAG: DUF3429 domain-containing protein [Methylobacterium sp. CG08_land_8_20_14_0_20_71_15]GBU16118.1 membrane protein [Methylobacterium sp.]GJE07162.1 hypothetical protein AOPFMNJM_2487 [Methylobacterium jeotgali]
MARGSPVPVSAVLLGIAGLIPFLGFAALAVSGSDGGLSNLGLSPRTILSAYGAVIASFLGGIRWGAAAAGGGGGKDYGIAILPSLLAWGALAAPMPWDLRILGILVLAWGVVDLDLPRRGLVPAWLGHLRLGLSTVAGAALLVAA